MTDHRELLELAARAMRLDVKVMDDGSNARRNQLNLGGSAWWNPREDSGDCADMCAALLIGTTWWNHKVECWCVDELKNIDIDSTPEQFTDHNNDKSAAWRLAALRVAADIGRGMQG